MSSSHSADERYRALLEHPTSVIAVLEAVWTADGGIADLRYVDANANYLRLLDTHRESLLGRCISEVVPDHSEHFVERCAQVIQSGVPCSYEAGFRGADFHVWLCRSGSHEVVVCATDITSRTRAEGDVQRLLQALNAEKEWLVAALNSLNEEVYFTDPRGRYIYANPVALREFGYASVQGMSVESVVSPLVVLRADGSPRPLAEAPPLRALKGEVIVGEEQIVRNPRTGEWRHRQVSSAPVRDAGGCVIGSVSVVRDVTDSKRAEARLREAVDAARAAEKESRDALAAELSAKSHFVRAASHDLRQSVQTLAMLNRSLRGSDMEASARSVVGQQDEAIDTMARLLDALLNISRLESGVVTPETTDFLVMPLFAKLRTEFARLATGKGLVLNVEVTGQPAIRSDPTLVGEILRNLLSNAIKFTRRGRVVLRCQPAGDGVRLEVADTGIGIPRDEQGRIFGEFYQVGVGANVRRDGYGLGLGIVQRLAALLQAQVDVESEPGRGSRFSIVVPAGEAATGTAGTAIRTADPRPVAGSRSTILLVEDDPSVRVSIERFFRIEGYRLVGAESLDQALDVIGASARPELLITDYHLPGGKTGLDVIAAVRTVLGPGFPAIMLSGDTSSDVALSPDDRRVRFASKPVDPDRLVCLVQELLTAPPR